MNSDSIQHPSKKGEAVNYTKARCGHEVAAVGSPGSMARRAQESRTCGKARCVSRLPPKFTDEECEACVVAWELRDCWSVDLLTKKVTDHRHGKKYASLIEFVDTLRLK